MGFQLEKSYFVQRDPLIILIIIHPHVIFFAFKQAIPSGERERDRE